MPPPIPPKHAGTPESKTQPLPVAPALLLCPKGLRGAQLPMPQHPALTGIRQHQSGHPGELQRLWLPHWAVSTLSPSPGAAGQALDVSSGANAVAINFALKHFKLELKPGKVQPVASDSSSPAKVKAVLVRSCLLKPPPPPEPCSWPQAHAPRPLHTHSHSAQPLEMENFPHQDTAPHSQHSYAMIWGLCSAPEAPSMALGDLTSSVPTPRAPATAGSPGKPSAREW